MPEEVRYHLLTLLESNPSMSQRELAEAAGVSVGKMNYLLRGLLDRGLVKAENFRRSDNKRAYIYKLTPAGVSEKIRVTRRYLAQRRAEYEAIRAEIERLEAVSRQVCKRRFRTIAGTSGFKPLAR